MNKQQANDWLNANATVTIKDPPGKEKLKVLDLYYKLDQQSKEQKRLNTKGETICLKQKQFGKQQ